MFGEVTPHASRHDDQNASTTHRHVFFTLVYLPSPLLTTPRLPYHLRYTFFMLVFGLFALVLLTTPQPILRLRYIISLFVFSLFAFALTYHASAHLPFCNTPLPVFGLYLTNTWLIMALLYFLTFRLVPTFPLSLSIKLSLAHHLYVLPQNPHILSLSCPSSALTPIIFHLAITSPVSPALQYALYPRLISSIK